jgi:predicted DCC family thiol-disulfide oxidoreductase YuxK
VTSPAEAARPVILFDGVCNLCTGSVRFVIERDSRKQFRFASLQSPVAEKLLGAQARDGDRLESVVLVVGARTYRKSTAALLIARRLDGLWPLLSVLLAIPRPVRDAVYDWIGRRRYRMFGKRDVCWKPQPELADRFLD